MSEQDEQKNNVFDLGKYRRAKLEKKSEGRCLRFEETIAKAIKLGEEETDERVE